MEETKEMNEIYLVYVHDFKEDIFINENAAFDNPDEAFEYIDDYMYAYCYPWAKEHDSDYWVIFKVNLKEETSTIFKKIPIDFYFFEKEKIAVDERAKKS